MQKHPTAKPGTPSVGPSKTIITGWLKSLFPDLPLHMKIEDFGDGVIYCRLLSHYYGNPPHSKITWSPKNQYQYANNLKHVQTALLQLGITITFDVGRVSKRKFLQNWALINAFYRHLNSPEQLQTVQQNSSSSHGNASIMQMPHLHQSIHGASQPHSLPSVQKINKRPNPIVPSYLQEQRHVPKLNQTPFHTITAPQTPSMWDHNLTVGLGQLASNSIQMSQYLKQNLNIYNSSPTKGKWSVGSQMFQNNHNAVIDRVKQILLKGSHDTEKVRQIKMLLGMPLQEEEVIKIEDDDGLGPIIHTQTDAQTLQSKDYKQCIEVNPRENSNCKQAKLSVSKIAKKPFKI